MERELEEEVGRKGRKRVRTEQEVGQILTQVGL